ncbi:tyrosine-type recombinase/integrase [Flavobacterium selenitireducens]|uniref:tyrosine-type recombinase/integrase n=1 Tax=Flavobacterium selenitireducens TaxID=2722704 RepID=UPI00168A4B76|nr:tyrosine-type recombinase/integrase [Flavobacterium selenitireducens]MBD3582741.1 tyrosine-type recombinase/integrase [Flavobacterium selenitireducens]
MATLKFRVRSNANKHVSIAAILSVGRDKVYELKTGLTINPKDWSKTTGRPKQNNPENKNLNADLQKLETFVLNRLNIDSSKGVEPGSLWLENIINECFGRSNASAGNRLDSHIQYIIDNAATRRVKGRSKLGISENRIKTYKTFKRIIEEYQTVIRKPILLTEISKPFVERFTNWLLNVKKYSILYSGKTLDNLKGCCLDAMSMEIPVHKYVPQIESFTEADEDRYIVTLSFDELEKIKNAKISGMALINARKWILIGCEIGQRAGDLLKLTTDNIRYKGGNMYIDLIQEKGKKHVTVGVINPDIINIIENEFPYAISLQKLNEYIKAVALESGLDQKIEGRKMDKKSKRKVLGYYPKCDLITGHSFRRSFASNYYKRIPTPIIMGITGHEKESTFLKYINKREDKDANADLFMQFYQQIQRDNRPVLKKVL